MIICIDIDGVLATGSREDVYSDEAGWAYEKCSYVDGSREEIQKLIDKGNIVNLYSARWEIDREKTVAWLAYYDIPYNELFLDKPYADIYIDDRAVRYMGSWHNLLEEINNIW